VLVDIIVRTKSDRDVLSNIYTNNFFSFNF